MASLPKERIESNRPFINTGVDYCGPIYIKTKQRKCTPTKAYIAIFVCLAVKAVHIELVLFHTRMVNQFNDIVTRIYVKLFLKVLLTFQGGRHVEQLFISYNIIFAYIDMINMA